jgi:catecholate siderophore receptor
MASTMVSARTALPRKSLLGLAISLSLAAAPAWADTDPASDADAAPLASDAQRLDKVVVEAQNAQKASSPKYTQILRDTPQSIAVVDKEQIEQQNLLTLREVLSTLPGITFGAGEGGGGYGDSINLRGFSANNDILVDGLRDSAQYTRSDPFNLQSVEVVNGANSAFSGAGSVGGTINLVSKQAQATDFTRASAGLGTDAYRRLTVDSNQLIGESTAVRLNAMAHENDVPGREVENYDRWGFAPTVAFGLGTDTRVHLAYVHQKDDNIPQYGVPFYNGDALPGVDNETYFGYANIDVQEIEGDAATAIVEHDFNEDTALRSITRTSAVDQLTVVDAPQGTFCLADGTDPATGSACSLPGTYLPSGNRGNVRDTTNKYIGTQLDFSTRFHTGAIGHALVTGAALTHETYRLDGSSEFRNANGSPVTLPRTGLFEPVDQYTGAINRTLTSKIDGELDNRAIYAFDTLEFGTQWLFTLGARYERNEGSSTAYNVKLYTAPTAAAPNPDNTNIGSINGAQAPAKNSDDLFSYRAGLVWKPIEEASVYFSYGNAKTPSKASVNGSCVATSTTGTANCNVDPESAVNYEIGGKWDVLDGRLSLTAAVFRNDRENYRVADPGNPNNPSGQQTLDGEARVEGLLLGVGGLITEQWSVYANYAHLDSEVLQGASDFIAGNGQDYSRGDPLPQTPDDSLSLWTTYDIARQWQVGYGVTYQGEFTLNSHAVTYQDGPLAHAPSYTAHRAMVAWRATRQLTLQLNVNNLFDEEYFTRVRGNNVANGPGRTAGWATPGDSRQTVITAIYSF